MFQKNKPELNAENYLKNIQETLDYMQKELPQTFVNLVHTIDVMGKKSPLKSGFLECRREKEEHLTILKRIL